MYACLPYRIIVVYDTSINLTGPCNFFGGLRLHPLSTRPHRRQPQFIDAVLSSALRAIHRIYTYTANILLYYRVYNIKCHSRPPSLPEQSHRWRRHHRRIVLCFTYYVVGYIISYYNIWRDISLAYCPRVFSHPISRNSPMHPSPITITTTTIKYDNDLRKNGSMNGLKRSFFDFTSNYSLKKTTLCNGNILPTNVGEIEKLRIKLSWFPVFFFLCIHFFFFNI